MFRAIDRKVLRDTLRMRTQLAAIALVLACGVGLFLGMRTTMLTLEGARAEYYARERFADVFASLVRAPEHVADRLRAIPGVGRVQTRIVADVLLDVPGMTEAATGRLVSTPDSGRAAVNDVRLREGRLPDRRHAHEVVALEAFATAHGLRPGATIAALIDGKRETLTVVGTALAPEFTYTLGPGQILPDDRRFGILWMGRAALGRAFDMDGAFNDVALQVGRGVSMDVLLARIDDVLDRYGGRGAYARADQLSEAFVANELEQLRTFGTLVPAMFLLVAAFLLNVVVGRIVATQREQIAALKAIGYRDREIAFHFGKLVAIVVAGGAAIGIAMAAWIGTLMCRLYGDYYRFPDLTYTMSGRELVLALAVAGGAAILGTAAAIYQGIRLPPAEAMRPPAPADYRAALLERSGVTALLPPAARLVVREIERRPARAALSIAGIALATALIVVSTFAYGCIERAMNVQFGLIQREDVTLVLSEPRTVAAVHAITHLPGVQHAEPFRAAAVRLRHGARHDDVSITGMPRGARLQAILDVDLDEVVAPADGIVLTRALATKLGARPGDTLRVEVREGTRAVRSVRVARIAETFLGLGAWMDLGALCHILGETPTMSGAWLLVDEPAVAALHARVKETPRIAGISERRHTIANFATLVEENLGTSIAINLGFALVMALGVLYNAARITLAERARDLASLRVLGFRRREVTAILLGEIAVLTLAAIPIGLVLGHFTARGLMHSLDTEQLRLPFVVAPWTYALATVTVLGAGVIAGFQAWRHLEKIDVIEVLKSRD